MGNTGTDNGRVAPNAPHRYPNTKSQTHRENTTPFRWWWSLPGDVPQRGHVVAAQVPRWGQGKTPLPRRVSRFFTDKKSENGATMHASCSPTTSIQAKTARRQKLPKWSGLETVLRWWHGSGTPSSPPTGQPTKATESSAALNSAEPWKPPTAPSATAAIFRYAVATGRSERDPSGDLRVALPPVKGQHFASVTEPKKVARCSGHWTATKALSPCVVHCALPLSSLCGPASYAMRNGRTST